MGRLTATMGNRSARAFILTVSFLAVFVFVCSCILHRFENRAAAVSETEYRLALAGRLVEEGYSDKDAAELVTAASSPESIAVGERMNEFEFIVEDAAPDEQMVL